MSTGSEQVRHESLELARLSWDAATDEAGLYDRMAMMAHSNFLAAHAATFYPYDLVGQPFEKLPAGLAYEIALSCQQHRQFMQHGARAAKLRAAA